MVPLQLRSRNPTSRENKNRYCVFGTDYFLHADVENKTNALVFLICVSCFIVRYTNTLGEVCRSCKPQVFVSKFFTKQSNLRARGNTIVGQARTDR